MNEKEIGRVWAEFYPKSGDNRDALQICAMICRLIRENTRFIISISRSSTLQRVLDGYGISKASLTRSKRVRLRCKKAPVSNAGPRNKRKRFHQQRGSRSRFASKSKIDKTVVPDPTANASAKWHRGNPQRVGAWARDETDQVSGAESRRLIALLHGRGLQCETISKSARLPDENTRSEPRMRAQSGSFFWLWHRSG